MMTTIPTHPKKFLLSTLYSFARHTITGELTFSFIKIKKGMHVLFDIKGHLRLMRVLNHPQSARITVSHPKLAFKYLDDYVSLNLSTKNRLSLLVAHYSFLQNKFKNDFLDIMENRSIQLWIDHINGATFTLKMNFPKKLHSEGDICLTLIKDDKFVYRLIFVVADGRSFDVADENVILISSIQGVYGIDSVKATTKACHDIHPTHMLMAAVSGIGMTMGIGTILGIKTKHQIANNGNFYFSYDMFFEQYGEMIEAHSLYRIQLPYAEVPISSIKSNHKKRTMEKRIYKNEIIAQAGQTLKKYLI